jgi:hypothetical protein
METQGIKKYRLDSPAGGLTQSIVSEVLNGFRLEHFDETIGASREEFRKLLGHFWGLPEDGVSLDLRQALVFRNALRETLRELGIEEFQTRTGYTFEYGRQILGPLEELRAPKKGDQL